MEKNFITKEQKDKVSNRLVLNFGVLLAGGLILLYVYNFYASGWNTQLLNVLSILGIIFGVAAIAMFVLGLTKCPKTKKYAAIPLGAFIATALIAYLPKFNFFMAGFSNIFHKHYSTGMAVVVCLILMAIYFIALSIYTAIYLKKHPVLVEKKKIVHNKKRK